MVTNHDSQKNYSVNVDLSLLISREKSTIWQFDAHYRDQVVGNAVANKGKMPLTVPADGALLVKFGG